MPRKTTTPCINGCARPALPERRVCQDCITKARRERHPNEETQADQADRDERAVVRFKFLQAGIQLGAW